MPSLLDTFLGSCVALLDLNAAMILFHIVDGDVIMVVVTVIQSPTDGPTNLTKTMQKLYGHWAVTELEKK